MLGKTDEHFWSSRPSYKGFYHHPLGPPPQILLHIPPTWLSVAVYVVRTSSFSANRMSALSQLVLELAIVTAVVVGTILVIVTVLAVQTVIHFSGIEPGIKCKELVAR